MTLPSQATAARRSSLIVAAAVLLATAGTLAADTATAGQPSADGILQDAGIQGGLVVHLGCGDGRLTAALCPSDRYLVHGLDADAVDAARAHVASLGLEGRVTFERFSGDRLPYVDNLVNLLVAEQLGKVGVEEVKRVLAPGGTAMFKQGETWTKAVKPWPDDIDEWTHFLHDAGGNAVAHDTQVGPPRHVQWMGAPTWNRNHHKLASISSVVSTAGRVFYIVDEGPPASMEVPGKWSLAARDAFSGVLLWKQPISEWAWTQQKFRSGPVQLPRTLVACGDRVYAPLGISAPVAAMDAATGQLLRTYEATGAAEEIILDDGVLMVVTGSPRAEQASTNPELKGLAPFPNEKSIVAVRADSGDVLWRWTQPPEAKLMPLTLAAADGHVFFLAGRDVVCLDRNSGETCWQTPLGGAAEEPASPGKRGKGASRSVGWSVATLVVADDVVLVADGKQLVAMAAEDGQALWNCESKAGFRSPADVFVIAGLVWLGPDFAQGRDLRSGQVTRTNHVVQDLWTAGHHHRCYREKATDRYLLTGKRGIEFVDLEADNHARNNWVRGTCQYGVMPSNGLIYAPGHACGCFMEAKLYGFWALAPQQRGPQVEPSHPLEKGPAYGTLGNKPASGQSDDWPTYRHDPMRSGSTAARLALPPAPGWESDLGGRLSAPVVADGLVVASLIDAHRVVALDAASGDTRWSFTAGGRVDSPPTLYRGLVLFGSADGWVYALRASDGQMAWRFRAAPGNLKTVSLDQVESVWPVHGSVLVSQGVAYAAAGRSSYLDGGVFLFGLDPASGKTVCSGQVQSGHPGAFDPAAVAGADAVEPKKIDQNAVDAKTFLAPDRSDAFSMGGTTNDVLVSDGTSIYLRTLKFDRDAALQEDQGRHLFSTSRLLDDAEDHRSHWVLGSGDFRRIGVAYSWIANSRGGRKTSHLAVPYGLMLSFDETSVWGVRRGDGYTLFAEGNRPFSAAEESLPDFRPIEDQKPPYWTWSMDVSMRPRAILRCGEMLVLGGTPNPDEADRLGPAYEGRLGGVLAAYSAADGRLLAEQKLDSPPVWDGLAAADGSLYLTTVDGKVVRLIGAK